MFQVNLLVIVLNNLKEDDQFEGINYLLISINGFKKSIKWYSKLDDKQTEEKLSSSTSIVPVANQNMVVANSLKRKYGVSFLKFLSNCRSIFEPDISDPLQPSAAAAETTINDRFMLLKSSQVTEIIQHMFDGVSSNSVIPIPRILDKSVQQHHQQSPPAICDSPFTPVICKKELIEVKEETGGNYNNDEDIGIEKLNEVTMKRNQETVPASDLIFKRIKREIKEEEGTMSTASDAAEADADDLADSTDGQHNFEDSLDQITSSVSVASDFESLSTKKVRLKDEEEKETEAETATADADENKTCGEKKEAPKAKRKKITFSCFQCEKR